MENMMVSQPLAAATSPHASGVGSAPKFWPWLDPSHDMLADTSCPQAGASQVLASYRLHRPCEVAASGLVQHRQPLWPRRDSNSRSEQP